MFKTQINRKLLLFFMKRFRDKEGNDSNSESNTTHSSLSREPSQRPQGDVKSGISKIPISSFAAEGGNSRENTSSTTKSRNSSQVSYSYSFP